MAMTFNIDEVLAMAVQIERNGGVFYRNAAEKNADVRDLLLEIAEQEDEHLETFEAMKEALSGAETGASEFDPNDEAVLYLRAMASGHVFDITEDPSGLKGNESLEEVIKVAIGKEKDSIVFYLGLKEVMPKNQAQDNIMRIIQEEMNHISWLSEKI